MHVNKILPVNYNSRTNQKEQKNPSFGKLTIDVGVSTEILQELIRNPEIKNLVRLYDNVGIDLKAIQFYTPQDADHLIRQGCHFRLVDPKLYKKTYFSARLLVDGLHEKEVLEKIKNLPAGTAIKKFKADYNEHNYPKHFKNKKQEPEDDFDLTPEWINRKKVLDEVEDFNATLNSNKKAKQKVKSFWEKLSDLFN